MLQLTRLLIVYVLIFFGILLARSLADPVYCTFCCNVGCNGANGGVVVPTASPTPTPTPTPSPTPAPTSMPMTFAGSVVGQASWTNSAGQQATLAPFKTYAKILITSWYASAGSDWCNPAKNGTTTVTICGPYNDFGGTFTGCNSSGTGCSTQFWNNSIPVSQWHLDSTYLLFKAHTYVEAVMDWRITAYVNYYKALLVTGWGDGLAMPKSGTGFNACFFDNGIFNGNGAWTNGGGVNMASWKTTMVNALDTIRQYYNTQGDTIIMNVWSDVTTWSMYSADVPYYRSVVDKVQYSVFEQGAYDVGNGNPLSTSRVLEYINMAFDYNTNSSTTVLWTTEYGADFWYNFTTGLLACTATKCGWWQQGSMSSTEITKTTTLDLGVPVSMPAPTLNYATSGGCYYRNFTKGIVVVNLNTGASCNFALPAGNYTDWIAGGTVSGTRSIADDSGKIFIGPL